MGGDFQGWNNDGLRSEHAAPASTHSYWERAGSRRRFRRWLFWIIAITALITISWALTIGL
jgi:hypothetical protein